MHWTKLAAAAIDLLPKKKKKKAKKDKPKKEKSPKKQSAKKQPRPEKKPETKPETRAALLRRNYKNGKAAYDKVRPYVPAAKLVWQRFFPGDHEAE